MSLIADTSRGVLRYVEETVIGTTPAEALTELRFTGESLSQSKTKETSNEIRSDRQITDLIDLDSEPSGDFQFEFSYDNLDEFLPGALLSAGWSTTVAISETDISAASADNSYNTTIGDFTLENLSVGQWIRPAGFTNAENNDFCQIVSIATGKLVVSGSTLVTETAGTRTFSGSMIRNGVTAHGYTLEKEFSDIAQFLSYTGMEVNTMAIEVTSNAIVTGTLGFIGRAADSLQATVGTGAHNDAPTNDVFNATSNIAGIRENGVALDASTFFATGVTVSVENGLRGQKAVTVDGNVGVGKGRCAVTGTLSSYFVDEALYDKFLASTATSLDYRITDAAGNTYIVTMPKVKYSSGNPELTGIDADVLIELEYQALRDPTTDCTIQIDKFSA